MDISDYVDPVYQQGIAGPEAKALRESYTTHLATLAELMTLSAISAMRQAGNAPQKALQVIKEAAIVTARDGVNVEQYNETTAATLVQMVSAPGQTILDFPITPFFSLPMPYQSDALVRIEPIHRTDELMIVIFQEIEDWAAAHPDQKSDISHKVSQVANHGILNGFVSFPKELSDKNLSEQTVSVYDQISNRAADPIIKLLFTQKAYSRAMDQLRATPAALSSKVANTGRRFMSDAMGINDGINEEYGYMLDVSAGLSKSQDTEQVLANAILWSALLGIASTEVSDHKSYRDVLMHNMTICADQWKEEGLYTD